MVGYTLVIPGTASPQGSKKFVGMSKKTGRAVLVEQSLGVKPWRKQCVAVLTEYLEAIGGAQCLESPMSVEITFYFRRPKSARHRKYPHKAGPGDLDKLQRAVFDAITTARLWKDDSQVCRVVAEKEYAEDGTDPRCELFISELD